MVTHTSDFLTNRNPLFWFSCFVRLFPRGDCAEKCVERPTHLVPWRWAKCLLTRRDFALWRQDVEFVASLYNVFLRRDQVNAVEAFYRSQVFTQSELEELRGLTAASLIANALSSGDVNSVRALLRKKNLEAPIQRAFRSMQTIQRRVRGPEAEKDNLTPKFTAPQIWPEFSSLFTL